MKKQQTNNFKNNPFDGHEFKKSLGQNFLRDKNLLQSIVRDAGVNKSSLVLEVGAGAGALTCEIASFAGAVVSMEVDKSLEPRLREMEQSTPNLKIWFADALKTESQIIEDKLIKFAKSVACEVNCNEIKVVANIPYYITTPLIFKFLKLDKVSSITIMVQKEVAERVVSKTSTGEYGALSVMVNYYGTPSIKRVVDKTMFYPVPKVDSAVLHIDVNRSREQGVEEILSRVVKASFAKRRKMLVNNLADEFGLDKSQIAQIMAECNLKPTARAEELDVTEFITLAKNFQTYNICQKSTELDK